MFIDRRSLLAGAAASAIPLLTWIEGLCGVAATLTLAACVTGLTDRDRRR